jgi:hypothetical protein
MRFSRDGWKLPWITGELSCLKNKKTKAAKSLKESEKRCLEDETVVNANSCERNFFPSEKSNAGNAWSGIRRLPRWD